MTKKKVMSELGVAGGYDPNQQLKHDEFIAELRGTKAMRKYREMRENDPVIGATLMATDMLIRATEWSFEGDEEGVKFIEDVFDDMDGSFRNFVAEIIGYLAYGFALFEIVAKRRDDGRVGLKKLAPRAQWTIDKFDVTPQGDILGAYQSTQVIGHTYTYIPASKFLLFRTVSVNNDPTGRSILRNAYKSYHYVTRIAEYEAIAIERELNGIPVGRVPSEYLADDATDGQKAFVNAFKGILRDVKKNEQGYILLPSDLYDHDDGTLTSKYMVDFNLVASLGTRDIDTGKVIVRHQQDIARTVLADFLMLGQSDRGSYAMSKSKADMFVHSISGYLGTIAEPINDHLIPLLWELNGFPEETMPKIVPGSVVPVDLNDLGLFIRAMSQAGISLAEDPSLEQDLRVKAGLPPRDGDQPDVMDEGGGGKDDDDDDNKGDKDDE